MASNQPRQLRILFIPFMAPGHMIPMVDMAKLFSLRGVKSMILTTYGNSHFIPTTNNVEVHLVPFPSNNLLPKGVENVSSLHTDKQHVDFALSVPALHGPFEQACKQICPDVIVSDLFFSWTVDIAGRLGVPRISFQGTNFFSQCALDSFFRHKKHETFSDDTSNAVVLPGLPHRIEMLKTQIPDETKLSPEIQEKILESKEAHEKSYGVIFNSFYELEPDYVKYHKDVIGMKAWHIGPVSICSKDVSNTGYNTTLKWLDSQRPKSVIYICFGSMCNFSRTQLREIAKGLEESGLPFIWVVRDDGDISEWMSQGLDKMVNKDGKGLIIKDWAPQRLILNHISVGAFMTHCGWNSCLESIVAGVPMLTWPLYAEQFYNEKLIVEVLNSGVAVGNKNFWALYDDTELVHAEEVKKAIERVMANAQEGESIRKRTMELKEMAMVAMECGGGSYESLNLLIEELSGQIN